MAPLIFPRFTPDARATLLRLRQGKLGEMSLTPRRRSESPWADAAQQLAWAVSGRMYGKAAEEREVAQRAAQAAILGNIHALSQAETGPHFREIQTPIPGMPLVPGAFHTQVEPIPVEVDDEGRSIPPVSAETATLAGIPPIQLKILQDRARLEGDKATEAAIEKAAIAGFMAAEQAKNWPVASQYRAILKPGTALEAHEQAQEIENQRKYEERKAGEKDIKRWTIDGREVWLTTAEWREDQALSDRLQKYTGIKPEKEDAPIRVGFVNPVNGITSGWATLEQLRYDITLPVEERQFTLPAGVSVGPDGDLIVTSLPIPRTQVGEIAQEGLSAAFATGEIIDLLKDIDADPGMTGFTGWVGGEIGGPVSQVSPVVGEFITETATGVSQERLQSFITRVMTLTGPLIPVITGERGRFTELERDDTKAAFAALKVAKSAEQIKGALFSILELYAMRLAKVGFVLGRPIDVTTDAGILAEYRRLKDWGLPPGRVEQIIKKIQHAQWELARLKSLNPNEYRKLTGQ